VRCGVNPWSCCSVRPGAGATVLLDLVNEVGSFLGSSLSVCFYHVVNDVPDLWSGELRLEFMLYCGSVLDTVLSVIVIQIHCCLSRVSIGF
jgi:hypothetical protein